MRIRIPFGRMLLQFCLLTLPVGTKAESPALTGRFDDDIRTIGQRLSAPMKAWTAKERSRFEPISALTGCWERSDLPSDNFYLTRSDHGHPGLFRIAPHNLAVVAGGTYRLNLGLTSMETGREEHLPRFTVHGTWSACEFPARIVAEKVSGTSLIMRLTIPALVSGSCETTGGDRTLVFSYRLAENWQNCFR